MSGIGILLLLPFFLVVIVWIKADSRGSAFYRQLRVGQFGKDFSLFKFRSMRIGSDKAGLLTIGGRDPRVTRSGVFIRKYKKI
jgi:lipopolysaccharide/colanic/teichoic acid biosynthesis glycosyltransferase